MDAVPATLCRARTPPPDRLPQIPDGTVFTLANLTQATTQPAYQFPCGDTGMVEEGRLAFPSGACAGVRALEGGRR